MTSQGNGLYLTFDMLYPLFMKLPPPKGIGVKPGSHRKSVKDHRQNTGKDCKILKTVSRELFENCNF